MKILERGGRAGPREPAAKAKQQFSIKRNTGRGMFLVQGMIRVAGLIKNADSTVLCIGIPVLVLSAMISA